ncbi:DUF2490 domain-containing protein [Sunxiuqinia sp. A32]|uniref:DUF2490 domain-containing protein n=1 Tax=Sunxiuqinia sp. A32 TaxID=3461496 RepID=UPI0040452F08
MGKYMIRILMVFSLLGALFITNAAMAQENSWNTWAEFELSKSINKKLEIFLSPEIRFRDQFKIDEYFIETGLEYEILKFLEVGGNYRFLINERETKSTEYFHRFALDVKGKYKINRFDFQLRTRYTNYTELDTDAAENDSYLRYRLKMEYDLQGSKLTPNIGIEFFHQLKDKEINKIRYIAGIQYKINKHHKVGVNYLIQDYLKKDYLRNILSLEYKIKF